MKTRWLVVLVTLIISILTLAPKGFGQVIMYDYLVPYPLIGQKGDIRHATFQGAMNTGPAGTPALPYFEIKLLLPPGCEAEDVEFTGKDLTSVEGHFEMPLVSISRPLSTGDNNETSAPLPPAIEEGLIPAKALGNWSTHYLHGYGILLSTFCPVIYDPVQKTLQYYQNIRITVHTHKAASHAGILQTPSSVFALKQVRNFAQNPEMTDLYPPATSDSSDYQILIIAPASFSDHFEDLIDFYYIRGLKSKVQSTSVIYSAMTGADNQEKIRNYIIQEYEDHQILHVLLAGDAEQVPARGFYCQVQSSSLYVDYNIPADLYYSALDGSWNTDGDNMWAEIGEDDLLPEVSVGRLPVSTTAELDNLIHKSLHYQDHPVIPECSKPLMVGEKLYDNPLTWGGDYLDLLIGFHTDNSYTTQGIPEDQNIQKLYDRDLPSPWTTAQLLSEINSGTAFLHHVGHSNESYLMRMTSSGITDANFSQVNGILHNYIPVYTHGCYCAAFDYSDCIAEKMLNLNNFAVAFFGNSRYGWFNEGTTEGPSEHLHREFVNALFSPLSGQAGQAHLLSKINTAPWVNAPGQWEEGALRWCFYDCNLLGDPAMFLWTDVPMDLELTYDDTLVIADTVFNIHADTAGTAVSGVVFTLLKDTLMIGTAISDTMGNAYIPLGTGTLAPGTLILIVSGYHCLADTFSITVLPQANLSGGVFYANLSGTPLDSAMVLLTQQDSIIAQVLTDSTGQYQFEDLYPGTYELRVIYSKPPGGINSTDALVTLRHFVQIVNLTGLNLEAADVNDNQVINSIDAFYIQKYFVGLVYSFPAGNWIFEHPVVSLGNSGTVEMNIHGISTGDVNGSFNP